MGRRPDAGIRAAWRKRLKRFSRSGLTVARFCGGEGVSVASFYHWRKKLGQAALRRCASGRPGVFRQVTVIPAAPVVISSASSVSIRLPCGTRIEVDAEHLDAVRAVVGEVARSHRDVETIIPSC